jgi:serine/threonine-protein kinase
MLEDYLRQDIVPREMAIARFMRGMTALGCVAALSFVQLIGWQLALSLAGMSALLCGYYTYVLRLLRQGQFHPAFQWVDSAVTVSIPAAVCIFDVTFYDAVYALTTPPAFAWGALITVCALRAGRKLAYAAATLVAVEYLALYFFLLMPRLPAESLSTLTPPMILLRAVFLFSYGPLTALLAGQLERKAAEALRAIREKDVMGKYFLHERLGVGGMAEVFRATYSPEGGFEKQVAVKRVLPAYADNAEFLTLFRREAELGSMLIHPNVVQVLDLGRHQGTLFLAMEYVDGLPLSALLQKLPSGRLPPAAVTYIGVEVAAALAYVHSRTGPTGEPLHLVHRDLNPPNILLSRIGEVKLSDFGVARAAHQASVTQAQMVRGKAGYMAPEQAYARPLDGRVDLFALGLTLHEALTGQPAVRGTNDMELMMAVTQHQVPPPSSFVEGISPELDAIITGLLRLDPDQRTPSGEVLQRQLLSLSGAEAPLPHGRQQLVAALRLALHSQTTPLQLTPDLAVVAKTG